jgi:hypothetical protein
VASLLNLSPFARKGDEGKEPAAKAGTQHALNGTHSVGETGAGSAQRLPSGEQNTPSGAEEQGKGKETEVSEQNETSGTPRSDKGKEKAV